jgi:hypothetical protein
VELNLINLEACIQSSYNGILNGYEFVPQIQKKHKIKTKIKTKTERENVNSTEERIFLADQNRCDPMEIEFDNKGNENPQDCMLVEDGFV